MVSWVPSNVRPTNRNKKTFVQNFDFVSHNKTLVVRLGDDSNISRLNFTFIPRNLTFPG